MSTDYYNPNNETPDDTPLNGTPNSGLSGGAGTAPAGPRPGEPAGPPGGEQPGPSWSSRTVPQPPGPSDPGPAPAFPAPAAPTLPPVQDGNLQPLRIPTAPQDNGPVPDRVRIGLWGAPRSGKTTYLAALPIAAMQFQRHGQGNWLISGMTPESTAFLNDSVTRLAVKREFPPASVALKGMSWSFQGQEPAPGKIWKGRTREPSFVLEIQDAPGEAFRSNHALQGHVVDQLARSQALIYLFDPLGDAQELTQSLTYFYSTLNELNTRVRDAHGHHRNRLPHHVSVCIAKFDHPDVFRPSVEAGWVTQGTEGSQLPRVPEQLGARYFQWMCDEFRGSTARLVRDGLANFFHPERISYYATSAIGFRLNPQHVFDYRDYVNEAMVGGVRRICTAPEPINVLEPLTDLERRIRTTGEGRRGWRR